MAFRSPILPLTVQAVLDGLVPVPGRHERGFLERLQRRETEADRHLHRHAFRIQVLVGLLDQDVPVVVDLVERREAHALVRGRVLVALATSV